MEDKVSQCPSQQIQMTNAKSYLEITHDRRLLGSFVAGNMKNVALSTFHSHAVTTVCSRFYTLFLQVSTLGLCAK